MEGQDWATAESSCVAEGSSLASVHSKEENDFLTGMLATEVEVKVWLGGNDKEVEADWIWSDKSTWSFENWKANEPNNYDGKQHCNHICIGGSFSGEWNDAYCSNLYAFICKKQIVS